MNRLSSSTTALAVIAVLAALAALGGFGIRPDASAQQAEKPIDLHAAMRRFDELYRSDSSIARLEMIVKSERRTRTVRMRALSRGADHALVVIEAPARDKGTATLRVDDNLWNYLPRIARTIRVPPSAMLSSWMGSDFTNDDLVHSASYARDFDASLVDDGGKPGGDSRVVRLNAKRGTVGLWKRIDVTFDAALTLPREARYFDRRLRHARTLVFDEVRVMDGHRIPSRLTLTPLDKPGKHTVLRYLDIDFDADVPKSTFSLARLERSR